MATVRAGHYPKNTVWATSGNMEYDLSAGWHYKRQEGWWKNATAHRVTLYDLHGEEHRMTRYDLEDETIVGFGAHEGNHAGRQELLAEAAAAFKDPDNVKSREGCGHIKLVEFAVAERMLRVTFTNNGAVVVYKDVPTYVAGTLLHWAKTKELAVSGRRKGYMRGNKVVDRHQLGVSFWDLIRIRGHQHGAKFPFEYVTHGTGSIISSKGRHIERGVDGDNYLYNFNDEEFALYQDIKKTIQKIKELSNKSSFTVTDTDNDDNGEEDEYAVQQSNSGLQNDIGTTENIQDLMKEYNSILEKEAYVKNSVLQRLLDRAKAHAEEILHTKLAMSYGDMEDTYNRNRFINDYADTYPVLSLINKKSSDVELKRITDMSSLVRHANVLKEYDDDGVLSWLHKGDKTRNTVRKIWTPEMLKDFGNPYVEGNITHGDAAAYKKYIDNKDWEGALRFLQNTKKRRIYKDSKSGTVVPLEYQRYADLNDVLGSDE